MSVVPYCGFQRIDAVQAVFSAQRFEWIGNGRSSILSATAQLADHADRLPHRFFILSPRMTVLLSAQFRGHRKA